MDPNFLVQLLQMISQGAQKPLNDFAKGAAGPGAASPEDELDLRTQMAQPSWYTGGMVPRGVVGGGLNGLLQMLGLYDADKDTPYRRR